MGVRSGSGGGALQPLACRTPLPAPGLWKGLSQLLTVWGLVAVSVWDWLCPKDGGQRRGWPAYSVLQGGEEEEGQGFWGSSKRGMLGIPKGPLLWTVLGSFSRLGCIWR